MQDCAPGLHGPWIEAFKELRKKRAGKLQLGFCSSCPSLGLRCFEKGRDGPQELGASMGSSHA